MNWKHWTTAVIILLLTVTVTSAQPGRGMMAGQGGDGQQMGPRPGMMGGGMCGDLDDLKLSDEQRLAIRDLRLEHQKKMVEMQTENAGLQGKLNLLIIGDKYNSKEADKIIAKIAEAKQNKMKMHVNHLRKVRDLLNDDQKVLFDHRILSGRMGFDGPPFGGKGGHGKMPHHGKKGGRGDCRGGM
ncbi:Spy/CpxP family protein refolding chaperone [bacterium]|nr:Spy/CpxP family protein refolding chaperone [bacterium]